MTFRQKMLAYSAAVAALTAVVPGLSAQEVTLDYQPHAVSSSVFEAYWSDMSELSVQHGELAPEVLVAEFKSGERELTATVLLSMGACGLNECPVRIYDGNEKIADFNVCNNVNTHAVNPTGDLFMACDAIVDIGRR